MKAVNNQHQLRLREQVHVYDGENTKSDENVYFFLVVKQSIAACLEYRVLIGNICQLLKEFQENW